MFDDRGASVDAEPRTNAQAPLHTTSSAPVDYPWERVAGVRLGRRSVSPQRPTTDLVCEPVSWEDAASRTHSGW
eukprot:COSAG02_NODE_10735_length_1871_cov_1.286117_1_plen_73_part_10